MNNKNDLKTLMMVVTHKDVELMNNHLYRPIIVGNADISISNSLRDNTGENISYKNPYYCELTALYWVWKNLADKYDYIGLCHYRRYFTKNRFSNRNKFFISEQDIKNVLTNYDIILPTPFMWDYQVKNKYHEFEHGTGKKKDLLLVESIIKEHYPAYYNSWKKIINRNYACYCNMFVMKKKQFADYCGWLFGILQLVENDINMEGYTVQEQRVFGYLSEILINVWVDYNGLRIKYYDIAYTDKKKRTQIKKAYYSLKTLAAIKKECKNGLG